MNAHSDITKGALVYGGVVIRDRGEMLSLTDMWKAAGSPENREPFNWSRKEGAAFIEAVAVAHNLPDSQVMTTKRGKGGATFAHWQIGIAYAKYLSHDFHMWGNQAIREKMEGRPLAHAGITDSDKAIIGNIVKNCAGVVIREQLVHLLPDLVEPMLNARLAAQNLMIRHGRTAGQLWGDYNLPRLKNAPTWLGNRLSKMGCQVGGNGRAEIGGRLSRVYDPDKVAFCMDNGLLQTAKTYAAERMGQRRLNLIGGGK